MLVVTDVKIAEVPRDYFEHNIFDVHEAVRCRSAIDPMDSAIKVTREQVRGRQFHHYGRTYTIGWSRRVQDALGIPFEAFDNMKKDIQHLKGENHRLREELAKLKEENAVCRIN